MAGKSRQGLETTGHITSTTSRVMSASAQIVLTILHSRSSPRQWSHPVNAIVTDTRANRQRAEHCSGEFHPSALALELQISTKFTIASPYFHLGSLNPTKGIKEQRCPFDGEAITGSMKKWNDLSKAVQLVDPHLSRNPMFSLPCHLLPPFPAGWGMLPSP